MQFLYFKFSALASWNWTFHLALDIINERLVSNANEIIQLGPKRWSIDFYLSLSIIYN